MHGLMLPFCRTSRFSRAPLLSDTLIARHVARCCATTNDLNIDISFLLGVMQFALEKINRIHVKNVLAVSIEVCVLLNQGVRRFLATTRYLPIP
jgi:hypothetical protein